MAIDPITGAAIGQTALGALGTLFGGRRRKSAAEMLAEQSLRRKGQLGERASNLALSYDPGAETADAVRYAQGAAERSIQDAMRGLNQEFRAAGGSPTGDTQFSVNASRAVDDIANPLRAFAAERRASEILRRMQMLGAASGMESPMEGMQMAGMQESLRPDTSGAQALLASGLDRLMAGRARPQSPGETARANSGYQIRPPSGTGLEQPPGGWMRYRPYGPGPGPAGNMALWDVDPLTGGPRRSGR